ncbi:phage tail protein [Weissella koreensis]|uniref:phage tail protein n=1 Tax=Weissella koreensis TaxID=165096 RepID=UPI0022BA473F|nr:phage tail protein [Weissella koreensis]MCZ9310603.1 phage tail protein [Weissella koreensis]
MELETLEVYIDANLSRINEQLEKIYPAFEKVFSRVEHITGTSMDKTEKSMDISKSSNKLIDEVKKINDNMAKQFDSIAKNAEFSMDKTGNGMVKGMATSRVKVGKEVDQLVNDVNSKMDQARAIQQKVSFLQNKKATVASSGNPLDAQKFDPQIASAEAKMTRYQNQAKALAAEMQSEFDAVPSSLNKIAQTMEQNEASINRLRAKIKSLKSEQANAEMPTVNFADGFGSKSSDELGPKPTAKSTKLGDQAAKQEASMAKLIAQNDALGATYAKIEDRSSALKGALGKLNTELDKSSIATKRTNNSFGAMKNHLSELGNKFSFLGNGSNNLNKVSSSAEKSRNSMSGLSGTVRMLGSQLVVFTLMYQGIMMLASGLGSALMTNSQFAASFNQIKVNLLTAFYPIYSAALPAVNALMSALSKATGYIAQFTSALFGMSYGAAKQGASGLYNQIRAMNDTASASKAASNQVKETNKQIAAANKKASESAAAANEAARKQMQETKKKAQELKGALMGFDEINVLSSAEDNPDYSYNKQKSDKQPSQSVDSLDDKPGVNFNVPDGTQFDGAISAANEFKKILADLFKPMQEAWNRNGKSVIDAWKYALREVNDLIKVVGKSFMDVWTNGTGTAVISNILKLLSDVLNIIGDVAKAFKNAWNDDGRGTKLIQTLFNMFDSILNMLHSIASSFRDAWNDGTGQAIATDLLDIFTNIFKTIGNLADQFSKAWNAGNVGKSIFSGILGIVKTVLDTISDMTGATADWAKTLDFRPLLNSIDGLLKALQPLSKNIGDGLSWFYKNVLLPLAGFTITKLIPAFLDALSGAIKVVNSVIEALKPVGKWLFDSFLVPMAKWTGGSIIGILQDLAKALGGISDWVNDHQKAVEVAAKTIMALFAFKAATAGLNGGIGLLSSLADKATILSGQKGVISAFFGNITGINDLKTAVSNVKSLADLGKLGWQDFAKKAGGFVDAFADISKTSWSNVKKAGGYIKDLSVAAGGGIISALGTLGGAITTAATATWGFTTALLANPLTWIIAGIVVAIAAVIAAGVLLYKNWDVIKQKAGDLGKWLGEKWEDIKTSTSKAWEKIKNSISDKAKEAFTNAKKSFGDLKDSGVKHFETLRKSVSDKFENIKSTVAKKANSAKDGALKAWETMRNNTSPYFDSVKSTASDAFDNVSNWAGGLGGRIASGLRNGKTEVKNAAKGIANSIVSVIGSAVNGVIDGVKWILKHVGASGAANGLHHWSVPKFANGGTHKGGPALVNDQAGSMYQEAYQLPNGHVGVFPQQRNIITNMPAGTRIMNASNTAKLMQPNIPHYAMGIGKFNFPQINIPDFSKSFSGLGKVWGNVTDNVESLFDDVKHPGRVLDYAVNKFTKYTGLEHPALDVATGSVNTIKNGAMGMVKKALEEFSPEPTGGSGVQRWSGVIRKALSKNGLPTNSNYTNAWLRQVQTESGGNERAVQGSIGDINNKTGDLAKGLLQTISATFNAYKFPGHGNIFKGYDNSLAAIHYAKSRYGSNMLRAIGHGHGYANGGPIFKHGLYEMGEGDNQEMVLPLTNKSRAWELMQQASDMMGFGQLQLPEVLSREDNFSSNFDLSNNSNTQDGSAGANNVLSVIASLLSDKGNNDGQQATVEQPLILELNDDVLGRTVIKVINKEIKRTGKIPLNI